MNWGSQLVIWVFGLFLFGLPQYIHAQSAKDYYKIASNYSKDGNHREAIKRYTKCIELEPDYEKAFIGRAEAYEAIGDTVNAAEDWYRSGELSGKKGEYYRKSGAHYLSLGSLELAEKSLDIAAELDSRDMEIWQLKTRLYLKKGDFVEAHRSANEAMGQKRTLINTYWMGVVSDSLGTYDDAARYFQEILDGNHLYEAAHEGLVAVQIKRYHRLTSPYMQTELLKSALENCNRGLQIFPDNTELLVLRSKIHFINNEYSKAIDDISIPIARYPDNQKLHMQRGQYYRKFGQHQNAINDFNEVIRINPMHPGAHYQRGMALEATFEHNDALAEFEEALRLTTDPDSPNNELYRKARNRILELNRESGLPVIAIHHPEVGEDQIIRVRSDLDTLEINGVVNDESRIKYITVNGHNAVYNRNDIKPEFSYELALAGVQKLKVATSDWYDNSTGVAYDILYTEIDAPEITINSPYPSVENVLAIGVGQTKLTIEGQVTDESPIQSIRVNGVNASFRSDKINPTFTVYLDVTNKNKIEVSAVDIHNNEQKVVYELQRDESEGGVDNPMGKTWVVFIENSQYSSLARIDGPERDVNTMKQAFSGYHVDRIVHKKNMTKNQMERFFSIELRDLVRNQGVNSLLVWYAGHGTHLDNIAYWIPVDARRDDEFSYFNINNLKAGMKSYSQYLSHTLIVTDACDAGPSFADVTRSEAEIRNCNDWETSKLRSSQILSASGYQQAAGQSPLTQTFAQLLQQQSDACMPVEQVVLKMRDESGTSAPRLGVISGMGHENGTFFFMRKH